MSKLVNKSTGDEILCGDIVVDFRGERHILSGFSAPLHPGSSGRVYVSPEGADGKSGVREYFPGVFDLEILK